MESTSICGQVKGLGKAYRTVPSDCTGPEEKGVEAFVLFVSENKPLQNTHNI